MFLSAIFEYLNILHVYGHGDMDIHSTSGGFPLDYFLITGSFLLVLSTGGRGQWGLQNAPSILLISTKSAE